MKNPDQNNKKFLQQSPMFILIFVLVAFLMISSALLELQQSKKELFRLMGEESHSLLQSIIVSSHNTLDANEQIELLIRQCLFNNASLIKILYDNHTVSNDILNDISEFNNIDRVIIFNRNGKKIFSSDYQPRITMEEEQDLNNLLEAIYQGREDSLFFKMKKRDYQKGSEYISAISNKDRGAIVLKIDDQKKIQTGFGILLKDIVENNPNIIYASLQDTSYILAASGYISRFEPLKSSDFLKQSLHDSLFMTRILDLDSIKVFEAVHPFEYKGNSIGLFRLGLSLAPIDDINARIFRRLVFITLILIIFGSFLFSFIFIRQRYGILQKEYKVIETYSAGIIENVSDAIIVFNTDAGIKICNDAAKSLFKVTAKNFTGKPLSFIFPEQEVNKLLEEKIAIEQMEYLINGEKRFLLVSKNSYFDSSSTENLIFVIRDLTELKLLEFEVQRNERLTAMGELAAGVAHEIRNPLNTISTIIQQLNKDFKPAENFEEYHNLAQLVDGEVKRINRTVEEFLRFTRPEPVKPSEFNITGLTLEIETQYRQLLHEKNIDLHLSVDWDGKVYWDFQQLKQVFINLIRNAMEAIDGKGIITLHISKLHEKFVQVIVEDNGPGMSKEVQERIFNLYYTTKAKGTGIGLSIIQKIIYEHNGTIKVESDLNKGTKFIIQLPVQISG